MLNTTNCYIEPLEFFIGLRFVQVRIYGPWMAPDISNWDVY